jgi:hypothetical protein
MSSSNERLRQISDAKALPGRRLQVLWSDGPKVELDVSHFLERKALGSLSDEREFEKVVVGDWGHSLEWPSGAEIGADRLWLETLSVTGHQDARTFLEWRNRHGLSLNAAASALGLSRRMVAYYSSGEKAVPRHILLACLGWTVASDPTHSEPGLEAELRELVPA